MDDAQRIRDEQRRAETTEGERFEADWGGHTVARVVELTIAHGSIASGVMRTCLTYWEAWGCDLGVMIRYENRDLGVGATKVVPHGWFDSSQDIRRLVQKVVHPELSGHEVLAFEVLA